MLRKFCALTLLLIWVESVFSGSFDSAKQEIQTYKIYSHPYEELEIDVDSKGLEGIYIFTYGSLMDFNSAKKTLSEKTLISRTPAIAFRVKRVFNRDVPIKSNSHWGIPNNHKATGMLNIIFTESDHDVVNGVLMNVSLDDFKKMREREEGYDLYPVIVTTWKEYINSSEPNYRIVYTFHALKNTKYTSDNILPRPGYYELSRNAARSFGEAFYRLWLCSTYLSDETTPIIMWERAVKTKDPSTQIMETPAIPAASY